MTTDIGAALRANRDTLRWLLDDQQDQQHDEIDADDDHREKRQQAVEALTRLVALADAPPTVAELLGLIDDNHDVRWRSSTDFEWRAFVSFDDTLAFESRIHGGKWGTEDAANIDDLTQPARLVEVTPPTNLHPDGCHSTEATARAVPADVRANEDGTAHILDGKQITTLGGLLATAPVGSIVETCDGAPYGVQYTFLAGPRPRPRARTWNGCRWSPWVQTMLIGNFFHEPARLVEADADADPATRGPLKDGES